MKKISYRPINCSTVIVLFRTDKLVPFTPSAHACQQMNDNDYSSDVGVWEHIHNNSFSPYLTNLLTYKRECLNVFSLVSHNTLAYGLILKL